MQLVRLTPSASGATSRQQKTNGRAEQGTLVNLLLLGYDEVARVFSGVVLGLYWKRVTKAAVWTGMLAGVVTVSFLVLSKHDPIAGVNAGFLALLCLNFLCVTAVSRPAAIVRGAEQLS